MDTRKAEAIELPAKQSSPETFWNVCQTLMNLCYYTGFESFRFFFLIILIL